MHGSKQPAYLDKPMVLAGVLPDSTAQKAGLAAGDHVIKINDKSESHVGRSAAGIDVHACRDIRFPSLSIAPASLFLSPFPRASRSKIFTDIRADRLVVGAVSSGMPAERSGLKTGDRNPQSERKDLTSPVEFPPLVQDSQGQSHESRSPARRSHPANRGSPATGQRQERRGALANRHRHSERRSGGAPPPVWRRHCRFRQHKRS